MTKFQEDQEFKEFRDLMTTPDTFEDGFGWGTVFMAFFVAGLERAITARPENEINIAVAPHCPVYGKKRNPFRPCVFLCTIPDTVGE